jgi:hypothetical protein
MEQEDKEDEQSRRDRRGTKVLLAAPRQGSYFVHWAKERLK